MDFQRSLLLVMLASMYLYNKVFLSPNLKETLEMHLQIFQIEFIGLQFSISIVGKNLIYRLNIFVFPLWLHNIWNCAKSDLGVMC